MARRSSSENSVQRKTSMTFLPQPTQKPAAASCRQTRMHGVSILDIGQRRAPQGSTGLTSRRCEGGLPTKFFSSALNSTM